MAEKTISRRGFLERALKAGACVAGFGAGAPVGYVATSAVDERPNIHPTNDHIQQIADDLFDERFAATEAEGRKVDDATRIEMQQQARADATSQFKEQEQQRVDDINGPRRALGATAGGVAGAVLGDHVRRVLAPTDSEVEASLRR